MKTTRALPMIVVAIAAGALLAVPEVQGQNREWPYDVECSTWNSPDNAVIGETQLYAVLGRTGDTASDKVYLRFQNLGATPCTITRINIQSPAIKGLQLCACSPGVLFRVQSRPSTVVTGTGVHSLVAAAPARKNGISQGEGLAVIVLGQPGLTARQIYDQLLWGEMTISVVVKGFPDGGSEAFSAQRLPPPT